MSKAVVMTDAEADPIAAINFAIDDIDDHYDRREFLRGWREGDVTEWPEYSAKVNAVGNAEAPDLSPSLIEREFDQDSPITLSWGEIDARDRTIAASAFQSGKREMEAALRSKDEKIAELERKTIGVCDGCGSSSTMSDPGAPALCGAAFDAWLAGRAALKGDGQ